jgi:hypothetical protein
VIARYVHYSEAYVRVEGLTVEVDIVDRHTLAAVLTWRHLETCTPRWKNARSVLPCLAEGKRHPAS